MFRENSAQQVAEFGTSIHGLPTRAGYGLFLQAHGLRPCFFVTSPGPDLQLMLSAFCLMGRAFRLATASPRSSQRSQGPDAGRSYRGRRK